MRCVMIAWSIPGAEGQAIVGDTHLTQAEPRGCVVIAHGFKGYKDYGMIPRIAQELALCGMVAHRFNFSHSGMTNEVATFERPDLFERDTWSKQVFDLTAVLRAIRRGELSGGGLPAFIIGHSRGGTAAILTASRLTEPETIPDLGPAGVITLAAPATTNPLTDEQQEELLRHGFLDSPSSRTGQRLRIGRAFLQEQLDDVDGHDVLAAAARLKCPMLIVHGELDETVPLEHAHQLAAAAGDRARVCTISGANHVFNTPNPLPAHQPASPQLAAALDAIKEFILAHTYRRFPSKVS